MPNPYAANVEDKEGIVRLSGRLDFTDPANQPGGGGGLPVGWTQDGTTDAVTVQLVNPAVPPLQFKPLTGATADATDQTEWYDEDGNLLGYVDATGSINMTAIPGQGGNFGYTASEGGYVRATGSEAEIGDGTGRFVSVTDVGVQVATDLLGFYATDPIAPPVVPLTSPTVQNVIDALVALGLIVQHN
jgi:hypothetical protein